MAGPPDGVIFWDDEYVSLQLVCSTSTPWRSIGEAPYIDVDVADYVSLGYRNVCAVAVTESSTDTLRVFLLHKCVTKRRSSGQTEGGTGAGNQQRHTCFFSKSTLHSVQL